MYTVYTYNLKVLTYTAFIELLDRIKIENKFKEINIFDVPSEMFYEQKFELQGKRAFDYKGVKIKYRNTAYKTKELINHITFTTYNKNIMEVTK